MGLLQVVSDTHLEFRNTKLPIITPCAPILALLGDIGWSSELSYTAFLQVQSSQFERVFVIAGNHELMDSGDTEAILVRIQRICEKFSNVQFLERESAWLSKTTKIIGCTLWSNVQDYAAAALTDFKHVSTHGRTLDADTYRQWHARDVAYIEGEVSRALEEGTKLIVLTHHAPSLQLQGKYSSCSRFSSGFASALDRLLKPPIHSWAFGHVHSNVDVLMENGVRCVSNCMGYPRETGVGYKEHVSIVFD